MSNVLTVNLGTASSKIGFFIDGELVVKKTLNHSQGELQENAEARKQVGYRKNIIMQWLRENLITMSEVDAIAIRVGSVKNPVPSGIYLVEGKLEADINSRFEPDSLMPHGAYIIMPVVNALREGYDIPVYLVDPANGGDFSDVAKVSGLPEIERTPRLHALNQRMCARLEAEKLGRTYEDCNFVIAHLGGGVSVAAHRKGLVIDSNDCGGEDGSFSGSRTGTMPASKLISYVLQSGMGEKEAMDMLFNRGGFYAYLGTSELPEIERRAAEGDEQADLMIRALAYRVAKEIGAYAAVLFCDIDAIILTGGMIHSERMVSMIRQYVNKLAPISLYPGEMEGEALAAGVERVLSGKEKTGTYK